jgi:hypothetical protein
MEEEHKQLKKSFEDASPGTYLCKKAICAGLGIKKSLLDSKAIHGGGPMHIKESNMLLYKKEDVIKWYAEYSAELADKKEKLRVAVFSMSKERQGNW